MFCEECGGKNEENFKFCGHCGKQNKYYEENITQSSIEEVVETPQEEVTSGPSQPKEPREPFLQKFTKTQKIAAASVVGVIVLGVIAYNVISSQFSVETQVKTMADCVLNNKACALDYVNYKESDFFNEDLYEELIEVEEDIVSNINVVYVDESNSGDEVFVEVEYEVSGYRDTIYFTLVKTGEKVGVLFDKYELMDNPIDVGIEDYEIIVPEGAQVTAGGIDVDKSYFQESVDGKDYYLIDYVMSGLIDEIEFDLNGFEFKYEVDDYYPYFDYTYADFDLSEEEEEQAVESAQVLVETLYEGRRNETAFEELGVDALNEGAYDEIDLNDGVLSAFDVTGLDDISFELVDGMLIMECDIEYDYTLDFTNIFDEADTNSDSGTMIYVDFELYKEDGVVKARWVDDVSTYFSKY